MPSRLERSRKAHRFPRLSWLAALLTVWCQAGDRPAADPVAAAERLYATLRATAPTADYARAARDLGAIIEQARDANVPADTLHELRTLTERFRERTRAKLVEIETATREDEAELEQLYRSRDWDDLSFALAAFPYWRAWLDLSLAERVTDRGLRPRYLLQAKRGFRAASMQLFQPSLVYGGWFGLGHTALAEGSDQRAREIFENLERALKPDPDHPLAEVVAVELRLLRAKRGEVAAPPAGGQTIDANEARLLHAEVLALLERQRKTQAGARDAAARLRRLIAAGHLDTGLLGTILRYRAELAAQDLGKYTDLIGAEYAYANEHFYDAAQKYQAFFTAPPDTNPADLDLFRYHWALANLNSDLLGPAAQLAEDLVGRRPADPELAAAATKLAYVAQAKRYDKQASAATRAAVAKAARRFLESAPDDPDADGARLLLAQTAASTGDALKTLDSIPRSSQIHGQAMQTQFQLVSREFFERAQREKAAESAGLAQRGLKVWQQLPPKDQQQHDLAITALQMRAVSDPRPGEVLRAIAVEERRAGVTTMQKQALLWARLRVMDRMDSDAERLDYLSQIAQAGLHGWQLEQIYPWIRAMPEAEARAEAARTLLPALGQAPAMDRRVRRLLGDALLELGDAEAAYGIAKALVAAYPKSGDGWQLLAQAAERSDRPFEAERAWRIIADGAPPAAEIWWEAMLSRIQIRAKSTRPQTACGLLAELTAREGHLPPGVRQRFESVRDAVSCTARGDV